MDRNEALKMQKILQEEVKKLQTVNQKIQKLAEPRNAYMTQLAENEGVIKELEMLSEEDKVYKLMGPVLVLQELDVAKRDVHNRISFMKKQIKQIESQTMDYGKEQIEIRTKIQGMQKVMMKAQQDAVNAKLKAQQPSGQ
mmetsp:Transcript_23589/g.33016  ORF Transcript_23589/g.33016 Transcript_23589/m.33016 type:complete len:140 (-) Transcript_23589:250-669(-)|eukprot:CAMPEP_0185274782 /NCGR_PEP_ID=MMETSP1359-20130426/52628_1 /TAXON_ID=552665 /ORGANISM="Bigelowiella longifila, Strain CCMP242" /LENGTH=139 /DNA_ID=CAMNT_0027867885 /DNA_START=85 /DNA_END=504 /DNA_ORIENTATION=-